MKKENLTIMFFFLALSMSASGMSAASVDGHPSGGSVGKAAMALNTQKLPEDVYGSGLYAYSLTNNLSEMGLYNISLNGDISFLWKPETDDSYLFNGWLNNGRLCGINTYMEDDKVTILRYDELDFDSGKLLSSVDLGPGDWLPYFRQCTYIPDTNRIFGIGPDEKNWTCVKYLDMDDLDAPATIVKNINYTQYCYGICYNPYDKNVYAVTESKKIVIVNQETGDYEELMDINLPSMKSNYVHGFTYLPVEDEFLFAASTGDWNTILYRIDLKCGLVREVLQLPNAEAITFFVNTNPRDEEAPLRPEFVSQNFSGGDLSGSFNYTLPTVLAGGDEATGTLTWTLLVDGVEAASGEGMPGTEAVASVTVEQGMHFLEMSAANNGHKGPSDKMYVYVGNDTPRTPQNVTLTEGKVTWDAVSEGVNEGYLNLDDLFYEVYINDEYVGETSETELTFSVSAESPYSKHIAEVRAICGDLESESGVSNPAHYGSPLKLDAIFSPTVEEAALFQNISAGGTDVMWGYSDGEQAFATTSPYSDMSECLLATPPIAFSDKEAIYSVNFDAKITDNWGANPQLSVYLMKSYLEEEGSQIVISDFEAQKNEYKNYGEVFSIPEEGTYYIVFKCRSAKFANPVAVKNIAITLTDIPADSPSVCTDVTAECAPEGKLSAEVTLTMPVKDLLGRDIPADTEVTATVRCGDNSNSVSGKPGSVQKVEIATAQGMNEIIVESSIGDKTGQSTSVSVFTGKDRPGAPRNLKATVGADNLTVTLTWDAPEEGADGHYFNAENLNYRLYYEIGWSTIDIGEVTDGSQEFVYTFPESDYMTQSNIYLVPLNEAGEGLSANTPVVVGKPYTLPMNETFENDQMKCYPVTLEYPSVEYRYAMLYTIPPYQLQEIFDKYDHSAIVAFPGVDGESCSRMALPKFSTMRDNKEESQTVLASFEMWTGEMIADEITLLGQSYDMDEPVEIGKVEPGTGWTTVDFYLPQELMDKEWVKLMFDSKYGVTQEYTLVYTYKIDFSTLTEVDGINSSEASVYSRGSYVYINGLEGNDYTICALDGRVVKSGVVSDSVLAIGLEPGVYVVRAGSVSAKVVVR